MVLTVLCTSTTATKDGVEGRPVRHRHYKPRHPDPHQTSSTVSDKGERLWLLDK